MLVPSQLDYLHRALYAKKIAERVGTMKFCEDGILLPFGASRRDFEMTNPTLFQSRDSWPVTRFADPQKGWSAGDIRDKVPLASNDLYRGVLLLVHDLLNGFCKKVKALKLSYYCSTSSKSMLYSCMTILTILSFIQNGFNRVDANDLPSLPAIEVFDQVAFIIAQQN
ncbi:uncharacterized protein RAG0_10034 [Rhynchosporium agropyri]|uniref:Uncharacterized protein n=1 Tax=Rhynchosporium agropyri TaxID=914238 RepID=A0A1E1KY59_9HELO|nr:uncharacterized protein RAG0_10034 [Rhynchosporium agropyri]